MTTNISHRSLVLRSPRFAILLRMTIFLSTRQDARQEPCNPNNPRRSDVPRMGDKRRRMPPEMGRRRGEERFAHCLNNFFPRGMICIRLNSVFFSRVLFVETALLNTPPPPTPRLEGRAGGSGWGGRRPNHRPLDILFRHWIAELLRRNAKRRLWRG